MVFVNYKTENNVYSYLSIALSATSTTILVNDWSIFPSTFPFLCTLEHYDDDWNCTKREIVKCTERNGDTLTIARSVESCVADDTANPKVLQQAPYSFVAWDSVSLTVTSWLIKDMQDEITRELNALDTAEANITDADWRITDIENFINSL